MSKPSTNSRFNLPMPFGWYAVALSTDLQAGEKKPLEHFNKALALFRTESGEAKLVDAMCPHLGAHLGHGGSVRGDDIVCAFHGWAFNGEGYCTDVPYAKRTPPKVDGKQCLTSYTVQEMNGVIWAWYHPENIEPLYELERVPEFNGGEWGEPSVYEWVIHAPIQETGENAVDTAHFAYVHTSESVPEAEVIVEGFNRTTKFTNRTEGMNPDGTRTGEYTESITLNSYNYGPGQTLQRIEGVFDAVLMGTITPVDADTTHMRFLFANKKNASEEDQFLQQAYQKAITDQVEEDIPIWNHKFYNENPILCDGDGPIAQYRKWFKQFYAN